MRFHAGFSFPIRKLLPFIGFLFVGCLAFFGIDKLTAYAWTTTNVSGYDVHAYRPLYSNETNGTCSPTNFNGCTNQNQLYNATGCNNKTYSNKTYCFFQNNNSTTYFSTMPMACNSSGQCAIAYGETYGSNTTYRPQSMLVWRWKNNNVSYCTSGNVKLRFEFYSLSDNSVLTSANRCAFNLNNVTSSIGICSPLVKVNNGYYVGSSISSGTNTIMYETTIPKPTTDLEIIIDDIQPFLIENVGEGATYSTKYWNYGFRLDSYECTETSTNTDSNAIINSITSSSQNIINNQNNNTNNINQHIDNSASAIVDSIDDLKDNQDENTQQIIDSQKVCDTKTIDSNSVIQWGYYLSNNGGLTSSNTNFGYTDYLLFNSIYINSTLSGSVRYCFYDSNKIYISCGYPENIGNLTIPDNAVYFRATIYKVSNKPVYIIKTCKNGNQAIYDSITDDSYNNNGQLGGLDDNFDEFGIDDLARLPLQLLQNIYNAGTSNQSYNQRGLTRDGEGGGSSFGCSPLVLPITLSNSSANVSIPCGTDFWNSFPSTAVGLYQTLVFGWVAWLIIKKLIILVEKSLDPDDKADMVSVL